MLTRAGLPVPPPNDHDAIKTVLLVRAGDPCDAARVSTKTSAVLGIGATLTQPWPMLALAARVVPLPVRDLVYDFIAQRRIAWFGETEKEFCSLATTPEDRAVVLTADNLRGAL